MSQASTLHRFACSGLRNVVADDIKQAADVFSKRIAKKKFGRTAYARTLNVTSWTADYETVEFNAFVGVSTGRNETTGSNVVFTVHKL